MKSFKEIRQRQLLVTIPLFVTALGLFPFTDGTGFEWVSFVLLGVMVIFSLINWRCPHCNKYLAKNLNPKFCPHCGKELV